MSPLTITMFLIAVGLIGLTVAVIGQVNKVSPGSFARSGLIGSFGRLSPGWKLLAVVDAVAILWLSCSVLGFIK